MMRLSRRNKVEDVDALGLPMTGACGALLVGVSTAKAMAFALDKPLIGVHHIVGIWRQIIWNTRIWHRPIYALASGDIAISFG